MHTHFSRSALTLTLASFLVAAGAGAASAAPIFPPDAVDIPDQNLRACLAEQMPGGVYDRDAVATLTTISCQNRGILNLAGLQLATGATTIDVSHNLVEGLLPEELGSLTAALDVSFNRIAGVIGLNPALVKATDQQVAFPTVDATYELTEFASPYRVLPFTLSPDYEQTVLPDLPYRENSEGERLFPISGADQTSAAFRFEDATGQFSGTITFPLNRFQVSVSPVIPGSISGGVVTASVARITITDQAGVPVPGIFVDYENTTPGLDVTARGDLPQSDAYGVVELEGRANAAGTYPITIRAGQVEYPIIFNIEAVTAPPAG